MKQILAIALSILVLGSDEVEAKRIVGKEAEKIMLKGEVIRRNVQIHLRPQPQSWNEIHYKNRIYYCAAGLRLVPKKHETYTKTINIICYDTDD